MIDLGEKIIEYVKIS